MPYESDTPKTPECMSSGGEVMCPNCGHGFSTAPEEDPFEYLESDEGGPGKTVTESFTEALKRHRMRR